MLQRRFIVKRHNCRVMCNFQSLLSDAVLLQNLARYFELNLMHVTGPEDRAEGGRLLLGCLLSSKESCLSSLLFKESCLSSLLLKSCLSSLLLKESCLSSLLFKSSLSSLLLKECQSLGLSLLSCE